MSAHRSSRRSAALRIVSVLVAASLAFAVGTSVAGAAGRRTGSGTDGWDKQVAPIAARVEQLRDLEFDHPVPVRYLTDRAFRKRVGVKASKLTKSDRRKIADLQATLRAFGLIDADTDIVKALDAVQDAGVAAFYDPEDNEIVVRGKGALDVDRKVTLAHELTHVLQDQHFDLQQLRRDASDSETSSSGALTALIEGDAERIQDAYLKKLSAADRSAYDVAAAKAGEAATSEMASAPELVKLELGAPYIFGPSVLDVLVAHGGNRAVDAAFRRGAPTDKIYLEPAEALRGSEATRVPTPAIPKGARRIGDPDQIGPFDLFTLLASRIDRQDALSAADAWTGDRFVAYRSNGHVCARATIASTKAGADVLGNALRAWAGAMPDATVTNGPGSRRTTVTSCDTGKVAAPAAGPIEAAMRLLATRNAIFASAVDGGAPTALATCVAREVVKEPILRSSIDTGTEPSAEMEQQLQEVFGSVASDCRASGRT